MGQWRTRRRTSLPQERRKMGNEGYQQENCRDRRARSRKAPNRGELSTCGEAPSASAKKREAEKRNSPCTPYREKGKGKESNPCANRTGLSRACARVRGKLLRKHVNEAVEFALEAFCGTRGPAPSDEALWANFAWRFGYEKLLACVEQGRSEMNCHKLPVPPSERPRILQNILREFWNRRFPKNGGV